MSAATPLDVMVLALGVLQGALEAKGPSVAYEEALADLEVMDHRTLARVAAAIAVESTWVTPPRRMRRAVRDRVERRRLELMVGDLGEAST